MKIDRLLSIIMVLMDKEMMNAADLAEMFEVSLRTIYRDIEAIGKAGIPIVSATGPGGGVGIMKAYKVEKRLFSTSDITAMLMGLGHLQSNLPGEKMVNTLAKVRGMIPDEEYRKLEIKASQVKIDFFPWHGAGLLPKTLGLVRLALDGQRVLRFEYHTRNQNYSTRDVEPGRLLLKETCWYLQGFCRTRQDYRTFKLLRMRDVRLLEDTFEPRPICWEQLDNHRFSNEVKETIKLRIRQELWEDMVGFYGEENVIPDSDGYYLVTAQLPVAEETARMIIGYCDQCECLEPEAMRSLIKKLLQKTAEIYFL